MKKLLKKLKAWWSKQNEPVVPRPVPVVPAPEPIPTPVPVPEPTPAPVDPNAPTVVESLRWVKWDNFPKIRFECPLIETWQKTGDKNVCAILRINGKKVEWIAAGRQWTTAHNAVTPGKYYRPELKKGDIVDVDFTDIHGKNPTNKKTLVWQ
jgi:hypothetical protein